VKHIKEQYNDVEDYDSSSALPLNLISQSLHIAFYPSPFTEAEKRYEDYNKTPVKGKH
jgi:hypothetical protein